MQEADLTIGHSRDINLLSTIVIMFLIGGLKLFFADMNGFPFKMVFAAAKDTDTVIFVVILLALMM